MPARILVVDDEVNIVNILKFNLQKEGYDVISAEDGEHGLHLALTENPDIIFLDVMMPKMDGYEVCKKIRQTSQVPIVMLTAKSEEIDKVLGFELGADDYVTKPFGVKELLARLKANLRKHGNTQDKPTFKGNRMVFGELTINLDLYAIQRGDLEIHLTRREFDLVVFLANHTNQVFTREELLEKVWGYEYFGDLRLVDVTVRRLRMKLEEVPESPKFVLTKRGVGYHFTSAFGLGA